MSPIFFYTSVEYIGIRSRGSPLYNVLTSCYINIKKNGMFSKKNDKNCITLYSQKNTEDPKLRFWENVINTVTISLVNEGTERIWIKESLFLKDLSTENRRWYWKREGCLGWRGGRPEPEPSRQRPVCLLSWIDLYDHDLRGWLRTSKMCTREDRPLSDGSPAHGPDHPHRHGKDHGTDRSRGNRTPFGELPTKKLRSSEKESCWEDGKEGWCLSPRNFSLGRGPTIADGP